MRTDLESRQLEKLNRLLDTLHAENNRFQCERVPRRVESLETFRSNVPFTSKDDLVADRRSHPPFGRNLTYPLERYTRYCQTSGTHGEPMPCLDTPESWAALLACWKAIYDHAGLKPGRDRVFFAFSFGPFLGFWTAFDAAAELGFLCIPGGGMSTAGRLRTMQRLGVTALCCTPTYALRLGEQMQAMGLRLPSVSRIIVAGEPGGSLPATRKRLQDLWGEQMRVIDHHGLTEVGPVSYEHPEKPGTLMILEEAYIAEVIDPETHREVDEGDSGELVLTTLERAACPLIRYRTGDLVCKRYCGGQLGLEGGILGRLDDMVLVRGVNVYPGAVENVLRRFDAVEEYQVVQTTRDAMAELEIRVELRREGSDHALVNAIQEALREQFQLRIPVKVSPPGSLPRYEFKSKRWLREDAC